MAIKFLNNIKDSYNEVFIFGQNDFKIQGKHLNTEFGLWARSYGTVRQMGIDGGMSYMGLYTSGTEKVRITSTGNVGIGTTSPAAKLDVHGTTRTEGLYVRNDANTHNHAQLLSNGTEGVLSLSNGSNWGLIARGETNNPYIGAYYLGGLTFRGFGNSLGTSNANDRDLMKLDFSNQRVGIGTTSPIAKLSVLSASTGYSSDSQIKISDGSTSYYGGLSFDDAGSTRLSLRNSYDGTGSIVGFGFGGSADKVQIINGTGLIVNENKLLIGTTSSIHGSADLQIVGATGNYARIAMKDSDGTNQLAFIDEIDGSLNFTSQDGTSNGTIKFVGFDGTTSSTRMTIAADGNVGIGTTSPSEKLHVYHATTNILAYLQSGDADAILAMADNGGSVRIQNTSGNLRFLTGGTASTSGSNTSEVMRITSSNVGIGTASPTEKLHVSGNVRIEGDLTVNGSYTQIDTDVNTTEQWNVTNDGTGPAVTINQKGAQDIMDVQDDGTSVFYIEDGGNVGIGTTDPTSNLHIAGSNSNLVKIQSSSGEADILYSSGATGGTEWQVGTGYSSAPGGAGSFFFYQGGATKIAVTTGGGLSVPSYGSGNKTGTAAYALAVDSSGNVIETTVQTSPAGIDGTGTVGYLTKWSTTDTISDSVVYDDGTNVGIGTTSAALFSSGWGRVLNIAAASNYATVQIAGANGNGGEIDLGDASVRHAAIASLAGSHLGFYTNSTNSGDAVTQRMVIRSNGNIGIGTASPSNLLHLESASSPALQIKDTTNNVTFKAYSQNSNAHLGTTSNHDLFIDTNNTSRITVKSSGNVGIGTTSPDQTLHVFKGSAGSIGSNSNAIITAENSQNGYIQLLVPSNNESGVLFGNPSNAAAGAIIYNNTTTSTGLQFRTNGNSTKMVIDGSGNVGIGTTAPNALMHLKVATTGITPLIQLQNEIATNDNSRGVSIDFVGSSDATAIGARIISTRAAAGAHMDLRFHTQRDNFAMIIDENQNVGIGTTSPQDLLHLSASSPVLRITNTSDTGKSSIEFWDNQSGTSQSGEIFYDDSGNVFGLQGNANGIIFKASNTFPGSELMRLTSSGRLGIGITSPTQDIDVAGGIKIGAGQMLTSNGSLILDIDNNNNETDRTLRVTQHNGANELFRIQEDGNVGIGTTSPSTKLHISGGTDASVIRLENTSTSLSLGDTIGAIQFYNNDDTDDSPNIAASIYATAGPSGGSGYLSFRTKEAGTEGAAATATMTLTNGGNVGIGTTSPSNKLHVYGGRIVIDNAANAQSAIQINSAGSERIVIYRPSNTNDLRIYTPSAGDAFTLTQSGNVGIGTTSPSAKLHVNGQFGVGTLTNNGIKLSVDQASTFPGSNTSNSRFVDFIGGNSGSNTEIGGIRWLNTDSDNGNYQYHAAGITSHNGGSSNDGDLRFFVSSDASADSSTGVTEAVRIDTNGNVGVGTTSPNAKLHVIGSVIISDDNPILTIGDNDNTIRYSAVKISTNGGNWYLSSGDSNTGSGVNASDLWITRNETGSDNRFRFHRDHSRFSIYSSGTQGIQLDGGSGGTSYFNAGNVGIGTTTPSAKLVVKGADSAADFADYGIVAFENQQSEGLSIGYDTGDNYSYLYSREVGVSSRGLRLNGSIYVAGVNGDVGIGTTSPARKLQVESSQQIVSTFKSSSTTAGFITLMNGNTTSDSVVRFGAIGDNMVFYTSAERMRIDSSGNVGVGTTSPSAKLHVDGSWTSNRGTISINGPANALTGIGITSNDIYRGGLIHRDGTSGQSLELTAYSSEPLLLKTANTTRVTIASGGNVGIGTTSPSQKLHVVGNTVTTGVAYTDIVQTWSGTSIDFRHQDASVVMRVDTANARVGIGTTNPSYKLDVVGNVRIQSSNEQQIRFVHYQGSGNQFSIEHDTTGIYFYNRTDSEGMFRINNDGSIRLHQYGAGYLKSDASGNITVDTSTIEDTLDSVTDRGNTTTNDIEVGNITTKNDSGIYSFSDTVNASSSEDIFSISNQHGAQGFRVTFVCSTSGYSVAKTFEVVHSYGNAPVFFKVVDTGAYGTHDFDVSFTNDATDDSKVVCSITNNSTTSNAYIVSTVFLGGSPTAITVTAL